MKRTIWIAGAGLVFGGWLAAADALPVQWPEEVFSAPRTVREAPAGELPTAAPAGIRAVYYENVPFQNRPTEVFAVWGLPAGATAAAPVPGVVLVHGGGGTAFYEWVRLWNERGFAAIAMDLHGARPAPEQSGYQYAVVPTGVGGPGGWDTGYHDSLPPPLADQWLYHGVAAVAGARTLLGSCPEVDADRIGLIGISWGGITVFPVAAADAGRYAFVEAVYGSGFLAGEQDMWPRNPIWHDFTSRWDPARYAGAIDAPMLMANSTNDRFFSLDCWNRTAQLVPDVTRSLHPGMGHSYAPEGDPVEGVAFARAHTGGGEPLLRIGPARANAETGFQVDFTGRAQRAELHYTTTAVGAWQPRVWQVVAAEISDQSADAPWIPGCTAAFFNVIDADGNAASSELLQF